MYFYEFFQTDVLINFSSHLGGLNWLHGKIWSRQYERGIPPYQDETFYM